MEELLSRFRSMFEGAYPPDLSLNDQDSVIDCIEDFLLYSCVSVFDEYLERVVQFFVLNLQTFLSLEPNLMLPRSLYQRRLLRALRFFRPQIVDARLSAMLEDIALTYLSQSYIEDNKRRAYVFLVDHFCTSPYYNRDRLDRLLVWAYERFQRSQILDEGNLMKTVVSSFHALVGIEGTCIAQRSGEFVGVLLAMCYRLLQNPGPYEGKQCDASDVICEKALRLTANILEKYRPIADVTRVREIGNLIRDDVRYFRLHENYLFLGCTIINLGFSDGEFMKMIGEKLNGQVELMVMSPFNKSKRGEVYARALARCYGMGKDSTRLRILEAWPLIVSLQSRKQMLVAGFDIISSVFESVSNAPSWFLLDTADQLVSVLELMKLDLESTDLKKSPRPFEAKNWLKAYYRAMKLIDHILGQEQRVSKGQTDMTKATVVCRLFKPMSFLLDNIGPALPGSEPTLTSVILHQMHLQQFRSKADKIFGAFISILRQLPRGLLEYVFSVSLVHLLPRKNFHLFNRGLFQQMKEKLPQPYVLYVAFFHIISNQFEELFVPNGQSPPAPLVDLTRNMFKYAFIDVGNGDPADLIHAKMSDDLFSFMLQAMASSNSVLIELLLTMSHLICENKNSPNLQRFVEKLKQPSFSMHAVLQALMIDPDIDVLVSLIALFLEPFRPPEDAIEPWILLFLPALRSETRVVTAAPTLLRYTPRSVFSSLVMQLREPVQTRLVEALTAPLSKIDPGKVTSSGSLLGRMSSVAAETSRFAYEQQAITQTALIDGVEVSVDAVFDVLKKHSNPSARDLKNLQLCFCQLLEKHSCLTANSDTLVCQLADYLCQKDSQLFLDANNLLESMNAKFTFLFLHFRFMGNSPELILNFEQKLDFVQSVLPLCYNRSTAKTAVSVLELLIDEVPTGPELVSVTCALLHAAQFEYKNVWDIIEKSILPRPYRGKDREVAEEMCVHFDTRTVLPNDRIRKVSLKALKFFMENYNIITRMQKPVSREHVFRELGKFMAFKPGMRYPTCSKLEFLFLQPFTDVHDKLDLIVKMIEFLRKMFPEAMQSTGPKWYKISPQVQNMLKALGCQDPSITPFLTCRFALKVLAKLFAVLGPEEPQQRIAQLWSNLLLTLREERFREFVPYFLHILKKDAKNARVAYVSLPPSLLKQCQEKLKQTAVAEDVMILRFICEARYDYSEHRFYVDYLQAVMQVLIKSLNSMPWTLSKRISREVFKFARTLARQQCQVDMTILTQETLQMLLFKKMSTLDGSIRYFADTCPEMWWNCLQEMFQREWSLDIFLVLIKLLTMKGMKQFRCYIGRKFCESSIRVREYVQTHIPNRGLVMSLAMSTMATIWELDEEENDIETLLSVNREFFSIVYTQLHLPFLPGIFLASIRMFLPMKYAHAFNENEHLLQTFLDNFVLKFVTYPGGSMKNAFIHPLFTRRFVQFMEQLSPENRELIYNRLERETAECSGRSRVLLNLLLSDRYQYFPVTETKTISVGFQAYPSSPMFDSMLLHYSGALTGASNSVVLEDLGQIPIPTAETFIHGLCIRNNIISVSYPTSLTRLLLLLKQFWPGDEASDTMIDPFTSAISNELDFVPYVLDSCHLCFKLLAQNNSVLDHTSRVITQFILGFSTRMLSMSNVKSLNQVIVAIPHVCKQLLDDAIRDTIAPRLFDVLLYTVYLVLTQQNKSTATGRVIAQTMELFLPSINTDTVDRQVLHDLQEKLKSLDLVEKQLNFTKDKFLFQLIPVIVGMVYRSDKRFFPSCLLPVRFLPIHMPQDIVIMYQKALRSVYLAGGFSMGSQIIEATYEVLKKSISVISKPLRTPLASVAQWIKEMPGDQSTKNVSFLLEVFKPTSETDLLIEINAIQQPLHPSVGLFLLKTIETDFPSLAGAFARLRNSQMLFVSQSKDLVKSCWEFDWFALSQDSHLMVFVLMLYPKSLSEVVWQFNTRQLKIVVIRTLNTVVLPYMFDRFIEYYLTFFPSSVLAECFTTAPYYAKSLPFPTLCLSTNMSFLDQCNLCEDSLGILRDRYPSLRQAVSFHQINNYPAAKFYYLREMDENPSEVYFYALTRLRSVCINFTLPLTQDFDDKMLVVRRESPVPSIVLPFFQEYSRRHEFNAVATPRNYVRTFTSMLSPCYIPFIASTSLLDEVYMCLKIMQKRDNATGIPELLKLARVTTLKTLDKQMMMASCFAWRLSMLNRFSEKDDPNSSQQFAAVLSANRLALVRLLEKSGDIRGALKLLTFVSESIEAHPFRVNSWNLPRVRKFLAANPSQFSRMKFDFSMRVRKFQEAFMLMKNVLSTDEKQLWVQFLVSFVSLSWDGYQADLVLQNLIAEMLKVNSKKLDLYIALIIYLLRRNEALSDRLWSSVKWNEVPSSVRDAWFRWLPILFYVCRNFPEFFIITMLRMNPLRFLLMYNHMRITNSHRPDLNMSSFVTVLQKEERNLADCHHALDWLKNEEVENDASMFEVKVRAHIRLYEAIARKQPVKIDDCMKRFVQDRHSLEEFCENNPPFFTTNFKLMTFRSVTGVRVPGNTNAVFGLQLEANGTREARITMFGAKGEMKNYTLVSPLVYNINFREGLFIHCLGQIIAKEPSSRTRSLFMSYPEAYVIQKNLMLVLTSPALSGTREMAHPFNILQMCACTKLDDDDLSPAVQAEKSVNRLPKDMLFRWLVNGAESGLVNFLFMRQSLANHFACYAYLRFAFRPRCPVLPPILLCDDRQRMYIPGFIEESMKGGSVTHLPLTDQIQGLFPPFVLRGSCATTWHTLANTIAQRSDVIRVYLAAIPLADELKSSVADRVIKRSIKAAMNVHSDADVCENNFAIELFDHLVEVSNNAVHGQPDMLAWI